MSTTVDEELLARARGLRLGATDAALLDEAFRALLARHRSGQIDESYEAYDRHPIDEPDEWGDLASFPRRSGGVVTIIPKRGELWWCELPETGRRPVVVLSRDAAIPRLRRAVVAPCTTTIRGLPSEVILDPGDDPVPRPSAINLDSIESVSLAVLVERLGALSGDRMHDVCTALEVAVDCTD